MAEQIIVPLDVASLGEAIAWVERLPQVRFWKVGLELFVSTGPVILAELKSRGKRIFLDLKFHDIPNTMAGACRAAATYGVDLVTVHAPAGPIALGAAQAAAIAAAQEVGLPPPCLLAVTVLTSLSAASLREDVQVAMPLEDYVPHLARLAQNSGIGGVVCSSQEITAIRRDCGPDLVIVTPGIRPDWATSGDQQRTLTPAEAIAAGANYLVIGRPITQAPDPVAAFERICASVPASVPTRVPTRVPTSAPAD